MADIAEQICLAVDQIVTERLKGIKYDTTIVATIVDNKDANNYTYICSNGSAQFVAYSKDTTYKINDSVQVTVPNNDYNAQKVIVGRYVAKNDIPYVFTKPFSTIVDVSSNLIKDTGKVVQGSLLANDDYDKAGLNPDTSKYNETQKKILLWSEVYKSGFADFSRLGIQGQFRSWIASLKPVSGNYGYRLEVLSSHGETIEYNALIADWVKIYTSILNEEDYSEDEVTTLLKTTPEIWFEKTKELLGLTSVEGSFKTAFTNAFNAAEKYSEERQRMSFALLRANAQVTELYLDSSDMYGNPYNFQGFFEQEKVFDISSLGTIFGLSLFFYEISATFYNEKEEYLPYKTVAGTKLTPNLFTKDPYICFGYDLGSFDKEQAILTTLDGTTYISKDNIDPELNRKTVRLRWLHQYENGTISVINDDSDLVGYDVRWYRFKMGSPSADEYSGVYWESVEADDHSVFSYTFLPGTNVATEQIKAIVLFNNNIIRSNIITFTSEVDVASPATAEVLAGLSVWCADNSYGNYCLYGQNNDLLNPSKANEILAVEAHFTDQSLLAEEYDIDKMSVKLEEAKEIIWEFPLRNSMIVVQGFNYSYDEEIAEDEKGSRYKLSGYLEDATVKVRGNSIFIMRPSAEDGSINAVQDYRIGKTYSTTKINNTIKCSIKKNGLVYSAAKELTFGIMGTNGTDATVVIDFNNNKTALTADWESEALKVTAHLYDSTHTEIDFNDTTLKTLSCEWTWKTYKEFTSAEEESIREDALNQYLSEHPEEADILTDEDKEEIMKNGVIAAGTVKITTSTDDPANVCYITHETVLDIATKNYFLVLEAKITGFGDYDLISYKAVPIRKDASYRYIVGPTEVIYNSNGYANYFKDPYQIYSCGTTDNVNEYDMVIDETLLAPTASRWHIYDPFAENTKETESRFIGTISDANILKPASMYVKGANPYGVACYENVEGELTKANICWIQPLVIMQNQYPSATLNKWNGKQVEIDHEKGTIVSPAIAAGKKNNDNTFSGVMIGDWSNTDTADDIADQTGVYGFNHGAMSFAFTDDGTAFIGKAGRGRIEFNGNTGILKSSSWTDAKKSGMHLDIDDGILKLQRDPGYDQIVLTAETYEPNTYYILNGVYIKVPHNTKFGEDFSYTENGGGEFDCDVDTVYYKTAIVKHGKFETESEFNLLKNDLYVKTRPVYTRCSKDVKWAYETIYYEPTFTKVDGTTLNAEKYNSNQQKRYYILNVHGENANYNTYSLAGATYNASTTYYTMNYSTTRTCAEEFNSNTNKNFYVKKEDAKLGIYYELAPANFTDFVNGQLYEIPMIRSYLNYEYQYNYNPEFYFTKGTESYVKYNSGYRADIEFYKTGYLSQNYSYATPDSNTWNQFVDGVSIDPNLKTEEFYYTYFEEFVLATGEFDTAIVYYKNNKEDASAARYITLSAAAPRFPLAIGTDSSEQLRKFKVEWDGTCHIQDGIFSGDIDAETGYLGNLILRGGLTLNTYGYIAANKSGLTDFDTDGFWLDKDGLNIGGSDNYFYASTEASLFFNDGGIVKVSGEGVDLYGAAGGIAPENAYGTATAGEGLIHMGWQKGNLAYPYIRFGSGTGTFGDKRDAGSVKKFSGGMWIGTYGDNNGEQNPSQDSFKQMTGVFVALTDGEIYRYEKGKYVQIRYAVFAPDDVTIKDSSGVDTPEVEPDYGDEETPEDETTT